MSVWLFFAVVACAAVFLLLRLLQSRRNARQATYVCDRCNELDCICHETDDP